MKKSHDQIIVNVQGNETFGGANCPFCGVRSVLSFVDSWLEASHSCRHVSMAVDAGSPEVAIHFQRSGESNGSN